jgi:hypothetical protein
MTETGLSVSDDLELPRDLVTQSVALLAVRRAGKSNAAAAMAEEMHKAGLPWVAIDPKGDWWGLRSGKDGSETGGLHVPVLGGLHGDIPLTPEAGHLIADLIVEQNLTAILDVSEFASKAAQTRFLTDLAERLFRLHGKHPQPRHVFLEEADDVIPQRVMSDMARCVGAWSKLIKQGGSRGLGITIISQRSAVVNKDALTQTETLIALRTTSPQDRKAILDWVSYHDVARELVDSLPGLDDGEAWVCSPHWLGRHGHQAIQRIRFRQRSTFDSGATPTMRQAKRPATLADIDLGALLNRMEAVVEKAAQDDPKALRRRIADLERRLAARDRDADAGDAARVAQLEAELAAALARPPEHIPVLGEGDADKLLDAVRSLGNAMAALRDIGRGIEEAVQHATTPAAAPAIPVQAPPVPPRPRAAASGPRPAAAPAGQDRPAGGVHLKAGARNMLDVLGRQHPVKVTRAQLATLARLKVTGGTFSTYFSTLRRAGLISEDAGFVTLTDAGFAETGTSPDLPITPGELRDTWRGALKAGARNMLDVLLGCYPQPVTRQDLAAAVDLELTGGTFSTYLSTLRRNGLAEETGDGIRAADVFFLGAEAVAGD